LTKLVGFVAFPSKGQKEKGINGGNQTHTRAHTQSQREKIDRERERGREGEREG
jgi:hypothetical protein